MVFEVAVVDSVAVLKLEKLKVGVTVLVTPVGKGVILVVWVFLTVYEVVTVGLRLLAEVNDKEGEADCVFELDTEPDTVFVFITLRVLTLDDDNVTVAEDVLDLLEDPEYVDELVVLLLS